MHNKYNYQLRLDFNSIIYIYSKKGCCVFYSYIQQPFFLLSKNFPFVVLQYST
ncbi:hypothetical protein HMPREF9419_1240 [Prevotella nigrescens ATCC 33563]|nr:hypothetical protein HMPREF9419_1240 [Prevotella nigrescens ATCC 33563]